MTQWLAGLLEKYTDLSKEDAGRLAHLFAVSVAALMFVLFSTLILSLDVVYPSAPLRIGMITDTDIRAPDTITYTSDVLTEQTLEEIIAGVEPFYDPPDPIVARQQSQLALQVLEFINNIRRDPYGTVDEKATDLNLITALELDEMVTASILALDDEAWQGVQDQISSVLERVMRESIRESDLSSVQDQLPTQVSVRFSADEAAIIVDVVEDLLRPNRFENPQQTQARTDELLSQTEPVRRTFERGQTIVEGGGRISELDYEALQQFGLLEPTERRVQVITQSLLASVIAMIAIGLYTSRFKPSVFNDVSFLVLLIVIFELVLLGARLVDLTGLQFYIYPAATLSLLLLAIIGPEMAIIGTLALALFIGLMANNSLEAASLIGLGGIIGSLTLRRSERLNSYFFAGLVVSFANIVVIAIFNLTVVNTGVDISTRMMFGLVNGIFAAAAALIGMYIVTLLFNLPTSLKLVELSQPHQPLLQRLLREAPGTYQHSLQVANLSEQAANSIGANAELTRVAALYHDIGKMANAAFFVENQADGVNPHDVLNDPYRSADIIIGHVIDGEKMARQYRLPRRIRDFIQEHHGKTKVAYFYRKALDALEDKADVDEEQFIYPGPIPQSKETALMMLADSCESTVRARRPTNKQEISDIIQEIIDARMRDGQLDDSGLTTRDIKTIRAIFVEMLQAVFHPRINYPSASPKELGSQDVPSSIDTNVRSETPTASEKVNGKESTEATRPRRKPTSEMPVVVVDDDDDAPLPEVPPLPRSTTGETRTDANAKEQKQESVDD